MNTFNGTRRLISYGGKERTIAEVAAGSGLSIWLIYDRWRKGDREERLVRPSRNRPKACVSRETQAAELSGAHA